LLGERFSISVKIPRRYFDEYIEQGSEKKETIDSLTKAAIELFETDKKEFPRRLEKQKQSVYKSKTIKINSSKSVQLVKLRARAILIKQKQFNAVAGV
jgi:hypothetical protein